MAPAFSIPSLYCKYDDTLGVLKSGVSVHTMIKSTSFMSLPYLFCKSITALYAKSLVCSLLSLILRSFIPVRVTIHSSFVSTISSRSSFVSVF